jgi:hypothetical protein
VEVARTPAHLWLPRPVAVPSSSAAALLDDAHTASKIAPMQTQRFAPAGVKLCGARLACKKPKTRHPPVPFAIVHLARLGISDDCRWREPCQDAGFNLNVTLSPRRGRMTLALRRQTRSLAGLGPAARCSCSLLDARSLVPGGRAGAQCMRDRWRIRRVPLETGIGCFAACSGYFRKNVESIVPVLRMTSRLQSRL